jgi:hypothetical protein
MVILQAEVVEVEEGLHFVSFSLRLLEDNANIPPAPPGIGGGGGGGGGGGAGMSPDMCVLSGVFWWARVSQSRCARLDL